MEKSGQENCNIYAARAAKDSMNSVATMFKAIAKSQEIHKNSFLAMIIQEELSLDTTYMATYTIDSTLVNMYRVLANSQYEHYNMYPEFIDLAEKEGSRRIKNLFTSAMNATKGIVKSMQAAIDSVVSNGHDKSVSCVWSVCHTCGNVEPKVKSGSEKCDICKKSSFYIYEW